MKAYIYILIIPLLLCISCEEETKPPFEKDKMMSILIQLHATNAGLSSLVGDAKDSMSKIYNKQVLEINDISIEEVDEIFEYLKAHPVYADSLYSAMIIKVNEMERKSVKE